jgi:hypothetical protein
MNRLRIGKDVVERRETRTNGGQRQLSLFPLKHSTVLWNKSSELI